MTTHMPPSARGGLHRGALVRGVGALLILTALVVGPPAALIAFVGNPIPAEVLVGGQFTDAAVIGMLAVIVWAAWTQLMLVTAIEAVAAIRGGALPARIPWCGLQQHFVRGLVVTASLLLATTGSLAGTTITAGSAAAAVAAAPVSSGQEPTAAAGLTSATTLDAVSGPGVVQDHRAILGRDRLDVPSATTEPAAAAAELWYAVRPPHGHHHDSLWDIAERHLGDGLRWREIYDLNRQRPQPDGQRLELARLIQPGWRLLMPADATGISPELPEPELDTQRSEAKAAPRAELKADTDRANVVGPTVPHARQPEEPKRATSTAPPALVPSATTPAPHIAAGPTPISTPIPASPSNASEPVMERDHDEVAIPFGQLTLGLGAVACAGLMAELARRRRRAQRVRRPGERLQRPGESAATAERQLHAASAQLAVTDLGDALRMLARDCRANGRALPDVQAITLSPDRATLLLGRDEADAVAPFLRCDDRSWVLNRESLAAAERPGLAEDGIDPYPALVSLGVTDDAVVLINLEAARTLTIAGPAAETTAILHALLAELGTSQLSSTAHLVLTDCPPELAAMLDQGRVTVLAPTLAGPWAQARSSAVSAILHEAGAADLTAARALGVGDDAWAPAVLLLGSPVDESFTPSTEHGVSVIRLGEDGGSGWSLRRSDDRWTLDPLGIDIAPQRLVLAEMEHVAEALSVADLPPTVPSDPSASPPRFDDTEDMAEQPTADVLVIEEREVIVQDIAPGRDRVNPRSGPPVEGGATRPVPRVLVLGPVEITGVPDETAPGRRRRATELAAYLALHPGATQHQLDEALWPGRRVSRNTRNPLVSRTRQWLGADSAGQPYLALVADGANYSLAAGVGCDWHDFRVLAERGLAAGADGMTDLEDALNLVRGRPFLGVNPAAYGWAEADAQDMISAIVDVAEALGSLAADGGDFRRVRWAAARGLVAEPVAERLHLMAAEAATAAGDHQEADRIIARLRRCIQDLDPDDDLDPALAMKLVGNGTT